MVDHQSLNVAGIRLAFEVSGPTSAPPLVLLHALGGSARDWDGVAHLFARHRRVYALELRGHARSSRPGDYALTDMAEDLLGFMDALGMSRSDVIGHSAGGIVAYLFAATHAERVGRLVLEDVPAPLPRKPSTVVKPEGELPYDWAMVQAVRSQIDVPDRAWLDGLRAVTAPTLVVGGGSRSHVPQQHVAELAARIPDGRVITIPVGHRIHETAADEFTAAVLDFLDPAGLGTRRSTDGPDAPQP